MTPSGGQRPNYVTLDDLLDDLRRAVRSMDLTDVTVEQQAEPTSYGRVQLSGTGRVLYSSQHVLDENGNCAACEFGVRHTDWRSEVNARSARDAELQAERQRAYARMDALDHQIARQEDAEWMEQARRIERGKRIPEREVRFSWLHGPEEG
jgi:hypothetical protein